MAEGVTLLEGDQNCTLGVQQYKAEINPKNFQIIPHPLQLYLQIQNNNCQNTSS